MTKLTRVGYKIPSDRSLTGNRLYSPTNKRPAKTMNAHITISMIRKQEPRQ